MQGTELTGRLTDLGTGGLACRLDQAAAVPTGQVVEVGCAWAVPRSTSTPTAARVSTADGQTVLGLEFLQPPAHVVRALGDYVDAALAGIDTGHDG